MDQTSSDTMTMQTTELESLANCETFWRDRYEWFLEAGYELPVQFKPDSSPIISRMVDQITTDDDDLVEYLKVSIS